MSADPALALVVAYLQLNGYFLITEQELHIHETEPDSGGYRSLTEIDVIAVRPPGAPGPAHHYRGPRVAECLIVTEIDPVLDTDPRRFDVIIGEVKTGKASINPALRTPGALHAGLRRTGDLYTASLDLVVDQLLVAGVGFTASARVRLVAFAGSGSVRKGITIHLRDAARFIHTHLAAHHELYRITRFSDPVVALLSLLTKVE